MEFIVVLWLQSRGRPGSSRSWGMHLVVVVAVGMLSEFTDHASSSIQNDREIVAVDCLFHVIGVFLYLSGGFSQKSLLLCNNLGRIDQHGALRLLRWLRHTRLLELLLRHTGLLDLLLLLLLRHHTSTLLLLLRLNLSHHGSLSRGKRARSRCLLLLLLLLWLPLTHHGCLTLGKRPGSRLILSHHGGLSRSERSGSLLWLLLL